MRHRPMIAGAVALALALSLTACGDDGDDDASTESTEASAEEMAEETTEATEPEGETTEATEPESETTEATDDTGAEEPAEAGDLSGVLLTPAALGEGFAEEAYETSGEPGPCGTSLDTDYPYDAIVGTVLVDEERQLGLQHEIRTYADAATAAETMAAAEESLSCGADTSVPGVTLGEIADVTADLGAEAAFGVSVTDEESGTDGALVVAQVGPAIAVYQFVGPTGVEGPDVTPVLADNVAALQAEVA